MRAVEWVLNRPTTNFYNSDDGNISAADLRQIKTSPISFQVIRNLLYETKVTSVNEIQKKKKTSQNCNLLQTELNSNYGELDCMTLTIILKKQKKNDYLTLFTVDFQNHFIKLMFKDSCQATSLTLFLINTE